MFNRNTLLILLAALAAGLGLWAAQVAFAPGGAPAPAAPAVDPASLKAVRLFPSPRAIAPFSLQQSDGTALEPAELAGRWTVVLRRRLDTADPHDVRFLPGDRSGIPFGLSVMDNTLKEHYASVAEERLVLLPPTASDRLPKE